MPSPATTTTSSSFARDRARARLALASDDRAPTPEVTEWLFSCEPGELAAALLELELEGVLGSAADGRLVAL